MERLAHLFDLSRIEETVSVQVILKAKKESKRCATLEGEGG